jgi:hypothetical protein
MFSGLRHWFPTCRELYRIRLMLPCIYYRIFYDDGSEWCALEHLRNNNFHAKNFFRKIELKKLANSEPGGEIFCFSENCQFVSRVCSNYWGVVFTIFYAMKTFITSNDKCISHLKVFKGKRRGQSSTKIDSV